MSRILRAIKLVSDSELDAKRDEMRREGKSLATGVMDTDANGVDVIYLSADKWHKGIKEAEDEIARNSKTARS